MRGAATAAFDVMRAAAAAYPTDQNALQVYSVLASQRYRIASSGTSIEFDPTDPLYSYVTPRMQAALVFAQMDADVAQFLVGGLNYAYSTTDGKVFPSVPAIQGLAHYTYPGPTTAVVYDHTSNSDMVTISGQPWCSTEIVTFKETCEDSTNFAPMIAHSITEWRSSVPSGFKGSAHIPSSPFNGPASSGNPYLVVSVDGQPALPWSQYNFAGVNCTTLPNSTCTATLQIDPVPYAEPGNYYDSTGTLMGTQSNPFIITGYLLADASHATQWATRTVNGIQEWGTFSRPYTWNGTTMYIYVKQY